MDHEGLHKDESELSFNINECDQSFNYDDYGENMSISAINSFLTSEGDQSFNEDSFENILEESDSEVKVNAVYPNEAYGDFMTLVTKYKLNNKTGNAIIKFFNKHANLSESPLPKSVEQGRKYMDNMNLPNLEYYKTLVINYNNENYYLHHWSLINRIKSILSIPDISQNFALTFENLEHDGERAYSEQNTGIWWENAGKSLPPGSKILSIILYSDATNVDSLGKGQLHPIYMTIGNIKNWRRNKADAKQLLGLLPILNAIDNTEKQSEEYKNTARKTFHKCLELLLNPLLSSENGIDLVLNGETIWFYPRISVIIADWPEAATYCLTYKSPMSRFPCHFCLIARDNLANINLTPSEITPRDHNNMQYHFNQSLTNNVCIENVCNFFWTIP